MSKPDEHGQTFEIAAVLHDGRAIRQVTENRYEVTTYKGEPATDKQISEQIERLRKNYTQMRPDFFAMLVGELTKDRWPAQRISDAVTSVLRNKQGGFLSVADIFSYDKPMKLYNYSGYCWLINNQRAQDCDGCGEKSDFGKLKVGEKIFFYLKRDLPQNAQKQP